MTDGERHIGPAQRGGHIGDHVVGVGSDQDVHGPRKLAALDLAGKLQRGLDVAERPERRRSPDGQ